MLQLIQESILAAAAVKAGVAHPSPASSAGGSLDVLTLCGFLAAFGAVACYAYRNQTKPMQVLFAVFLLTLSAYAFAKGAWPVGLAELVWVGIALRRCLCRLGVPQPPPVAIRVNTDDGIQPNWHSGLSPTLMNEESRTERLFGKR